MASMAKTVTRTARAMRGGGRTGTRHPLVAAAMVLPLAALLAYAFGGVDAVVTQASSVAGLMGR
jgi:DNA-binding transcriptional regulator YbjK